MFKDWDDLDRNQVDQKYFNIEMILIRTLLSVSASASTCRFCSTWEAAFKGVANRGKPSDKTKDLGSPKLLDLLLSSFLLFRRLKLPGPPLPQIKIVHEEEEEEDE